MSVEAVIQALIPVSAAPAAIAAIVADRIAMVELPQGTAYPALVWTPISGVPMYPIRAADGPQLKRSRVQFTLLAKDFTTLLNLRAAVGQAVNFKSGVIGGVTVVGIVLELDGPQAKDEESKVYMQTVDYMVIFYD